MRGDLPIELSLGLVRAERKNTEPIEFTQDSGDRPLDVVGATLAALLLVSEHFIDVLLDNRFTGWTTFPTTVSLSNGNPLPGYSGLAVTGRCGPIDDSLSEEVVLPPPVPGGRERRALRGLCFPPDSWDGSDLFMTEDGGEMIFVVEAVKDALEAARVTNLAFRRLCEFERVWRADGSLIDG